MADQKYSREDRNQIRKANNTYIRGLKREAAEKRQQERDSRTAQEQYDLLVANGHGSCAEAQRLLAEIKNQNDSSEPDD